MVDAVAAAEQLAEDLLWPAALEIDRAEAVPIRVLDALAAAGLYGLVGPPAAGGWGADPRTAGRVAEALAGASLATTFVWVQHNSSVRMAAAARPEIRERWLEDLCAGRVRSGVAVAALRRPGPPAMVAGRDPGGGARLTGSAPWVTGWGRVDVVLVAARDGEDLVWCLVDAAPAPGLRVEPLALAAMASTSTVTLHLDGLAVPADRVLAVEPYAGWMERDRRGLRFNGHLPLGLAARAGRLLERPELIDAVDAIRERLDGAADGDVPVARADASLLALRATAALVAARGGRAVELGDHAQRLAREAMFLTVFGQTRDIRAAQLARLLDPAPGPGPSAS